jgi:phenylpyruvate tautomerase PptA (4-oxalocrotonate tautomerase family)
MPRLELTFPEGALSDQAKTELPAKMAETMLQWEGAPDTDFFRSISWTHLHEMPAGTLHTADGPAEDSQFIVDVTVPSGALSDRRKEGLVKDLTALVAEAAGLPAEEQMRLWVIVNEVPDGNWGAAGNVIRFEALREAAKAEREKAEAKTPA